MKYIDLSHTLRPGIPLYPGTPELVVRKAATLERDGCRTTSLAHSSHVGTHVDAPAHMLDGGVTLDMLPPSQFAGTGAVVDCSFLPAGAPILPELIEPAAGLEIDFLLLYTGQDRLWPQPEYVRPNAYLSRDAARLISALSLKGVGIDNMSVDPVDAERYPAHELLLGAGMVIYENLKNLGKLPEAPFAFFGFPALYVDADGAPVRAVARLD